jgi:uncharacterized lipoprotein NlpE involved in copper resistance
MRKVLVILAATLFVAALIGCDDKADQKKAPAADTTKVAPAVTPAPVATPAPAADTTKK